MTSVQTMCNIAFEKVNKDFSWGNYGGFKALIMNTNGYINVTKLAKDVGKEFFTWKQNKAADELQNEISLALGIPRANLLMVINGGVQEIDLIIRGTYAHPDLVPHIASWVSPKFAVKVSRIVNEYFAQEARDKVRDLTKERDDLLTMMRKLCVDTEEIKSRSDNILAKNEELVTKLDTVKEQNTELVTKLDTVKEQNTELVTKLDTVKEQNTELVTKLDTVKEQNTELVTKLDTVKEQNTELVTKLDTVKEQNTELVTKLDTVKVQNEHLNEKVDDLAVANEILDEKINVISKRLAIGPSTADKEMVFMLLSKKLVDKSRVYYIIRGQNKAAKAKRNRFREDGYKTKMYFLDPNPIDLTDRVRSKLNNTIISMRYNEFILMEGVKEKDLLKAIGEIRDEKYRECNHKVANQ